MDALFAIEPSINGKSAEERLAARRTLSRPLVDDLHALMSAQLLRLARGHDLVKAINYVLKRWPAFTLFLEDGRVSSGPDTARWFWGVLEVNLVPRRSPDAPLLPEP